jgi:hypothetical protein
MLAIGSHHDAGRFGHRLAVGGVPADSHRATVGDEHLVHVKALADLRPGLARGVDQERVEDGAAGTVQRVDALVGLVAAGQDVVAGVEPDLPGGRRP